MGISYSEDDHRWIGNQREVTVTATLDDSYTNGGEGLTPDDVGLDAIENVTIESGLTSAGNPVEWDPSGEVLVVYDGTHSEQADATDLSGETIRLSVRGRS